MAMGRVTALVLASLLIVSTAGCMENEIQTVSVYFLLPIIGIQETEDGPEFYGEVIVDRIDPAGVEVWAWDISFEPSHPHDGSKKEPIPLEPGGSVSNGNLQVMLVGDLDSDERLDEGDTIRIMGLTSDSIWTRYSIVIDLPNFHTWGSFDIRGHMMDTELELVEWREVGSEVFFDVTMSIDPVVLLEGAIRWSYLMVTIKLQDSVTESEYQVEMYDNTKGNHTQVWYIDNEGDKSSVDEGDKLFLTGLGIPHLNGYVYVNMIEMGFQSLHDLPTDFSDW